MSDVWGCQGGVYRRIQIFKGCSIGFSGNNGSFSFKFCTQQNIAKKKGEGSDPWNPTPRSATDPFKTESEGV